MTEVVAHAIERRAEWLEPRQTSYDLKPRRGAENEGRPRYLRDRRPLAHRALSLLRLQAGMPFLLLPAMERRPSGSR